MFWLELGSGRDYVLELYILVGTVLWHGICSGRDVPDWTMFRQGLCSSRDYVGAGTMFWQGLCYGRDVPEWTIFWQGLCSGRYYVMAGTVLEGMFQNGLSFDRDYVLAGNIFGQGPCSGRDLSFRFAYAL